MWVESYIELKGRSLAHSVLLLRKSTCCILCGLCGERVLDIVPGGMELELQLRRGVGKAAHTRNNPHVKCVGVY
jgi:hypothetical protein